MHSRALVVSVVFFVIFLTCDSVILRPKWFPYFKKEGEAQSYQGQSQWPAETLGARQARTVSREPCLEDVTDQRCGKLILMALYRLLNENNQ